MNESSHAFRTARDMLLNLRDDQATAVRQFRWPRLEYFNWAIDHFDEMASGNDAPALWIVEADGTEARLSFAQLAASSSRVANFLRSNGVRCGERVLLMLGNEVALWETMLGCMKLGAVVIPATALLTTEDIRDRLERGAVRHVLTAAGHVGKFKDLPGGYTRICVGPRQEGWISLDDARTDSPEFVEQYVS